MQRRVSFSKVGTTLSGDDATRLVAAYRKTGVAAEDWKAKPGFVYTQVRAISARVNQNYDAWPSSQLKKYYKTFVGKPVFVNHGNEDPERARGVVVAARYIEKGADRYVETIMETDAVRFPKLAREIVSGGLDSVSMGVEAGFTICSVCDHRATDESNMCDHILLHKGEHMKNTKTGKRTLVFEKCFKLGFFELSYVFDPADETAVVSRVISANRRSAGAVDDVHFSNESGAHSVAVLPDGHRLSVFSPSDTFPDSRWQWVHEQGTPNRHNPHVHDYDVVNHGDGENADHAKDQAMASYQAAKAADRLGADEWDPDQDLRALYGATIKKATRKGDFMAHWYRKAELPRLLKNKAPEDIDTLRDESDDDTDLFHHWVQSPMELRAPSMDRSHKLDADQERGGLDDDRNSELAEEVSMPSGDKKGDPVMPINPPELKKGRRTTRGVGMSRYYAADEDEGYGDGAGLEDEAYGGDEGYGDDQSDMGGEDMGPEMGGDIGSLLDEAEGDIEAFESEEGLEDGDEGDYDDDGDDDSDPMGDYDEDYAGADGQQMQARRRRRAALDPRDDESGSSYRDHSISRHRGNGMYSVMLDGKGMHSADTLDGIRDTIDDHLDGGRRESRRRQADPVRSARSRGNKRGGTMRRTTLASRTAKGRHFMADDSGHTDGGPYGIDDSQGNSEEVFISQVPGAEAVAAPVEGDSPISNTENNLVASRQPQFDPGHYQRLADVVRALPPAQRGAMARKMVAMLTADHPNFNGRTFYEAAAVPVVKRGNRYFYAEDLEDPTTVDPELSGTDVQELADGDFDSLALDNVETQPKDASIHAFRAFDSWLHKATGRTARQHRNANFIRRAAASYSGQWQNPQAKLATLFPTLEYVLAEARKFEGGTMRQRRAQDESLSVAAPQDRIDVEAPVKNVTDADAQASQFDLSDFAHNAGDQLADPVLDVVDGNAGTWAPDKGKESRKLATGVEAVRLADAYIKAYPGTYSDKDRWTLTARFETLRSPVVRDRIRVLEAVVADQSKQSKKTARKVAAAGSRGTRGIPVGFANQRVASTRRISASDPDTDSALFI